jgi:hypothetical protein
MQALQLSLSRQQPIERIPVGLPVATGMDAMVQLHCQRLETLLLQQGGQILRQPFGAGEFAQANFGGELPAGGGCPGGGIGPSGEQRVACGVEPFSNGTSRAHGLPSLATRIVSPAWAASISLEKWVLAS